MEITVETARENPCVQRKEVKGRIVFVGATPSNRQVADALAVKMNVKPEVINMVHIYTSFGSQSAVFEAEVYKDRARLEKFVRIDKKAAEKIAKAGAVPEEKKAGVLHAGEKPGEKKPGVKPVVKTEEKKPVVGKKA